MKPFQPILGAGKSKDMTDDEFFSKVLYPVICTPKFDGIRCTTIPGQILVTDSSRPVCRSLDNLPNYHIQKRLAQLPPGLDGEIVTYDSATLFDQTRVRKFYQVQSDVMSEQGAPVFKFHVFDFHDFGIQYPWLEPYAERLHKLSLMDLPGCCEKVPSVTCRSREEIEAYESKCIESGYEGICWRWIQAPYKYGRSTLNQQWLIKMKRFETAEAEVMYAYEEMHNANEAKRNERGHLERSSHQENMQGKNTLGGLCVQSKNFTLPFNIGSGFDSEQREKLWKERQFLPKRIVTFKYQPHGTKDKPRIPIFLGFRDRRDL